MSGKQRNRTLISISALVLLGGAVFLGYKTCLSDVRKPLAYSSTIAGFGKEFGETFGIAVRDGAIYVSDGENGDIKVIRDGHVSTFATGLDTPSGLAFDKSGNLIVADAGAHAVRSIDRQGVLTDIASSFRGPTGVAVGGNGKIFVADTYNDRVCVIDNGNVSVLAGGKRGYADGASAEAKFDTPVGLALWNDRLLVADSGNRRVRVIEADGSVWTLVGNNSDDLRDGLLQQSSFVEPTAVIVSESNEIFVADGNAIRVISGDVVPTVRTLSNEGRGFRDGDLRRARFNRPSGLAFAADGSLLVADAENRVVRSLNTSPAKEATSDQIPAMNETPEEFRQLQPARWPYDPPQAPRDIAGTLGELRGEIKPGNAEIHFHNGLDIAGAYGETARSIRSEKVLKPIAADNFGTLRELLRMPTLGYIHIRLGRSADNKVFDDDRFLFERDASGKLIGVRVPRGASFRSGEPIGTLNAMNHVHLIAGRTGNEMNAISGLILPGIADTKPPTVDAVTITDENWRTLETKSASGRVQLSGRIRVIMQAFDQMNGGAAKRRLGLYQAGYALLKKDGSPLVEQQWTIRFDKLPPQRAVPFVYADGSRSGATGETIFRFIVTNRVVSGEYREDLLDTTKLDAGEFTLRACAADYFGNTTCSDTAVEIIK